MLMSYLPAQNRHILIFLLNATPILFHVILLPQSVSPSNLMEKVLKNAKS